MVPSFWAVHIPIHLLLYQLMTVSHGFNLGKASAVCLPGNPSPEFKVHRRVGVGEGGGCFQSKQGQKGSTAPKKESSLGEALTSSLLSTLNTSRSRWLLLASAQPTVHFVRFMWHYESCSNSMHAGHKQEESLSHPPVKHYVSVSLISVFFFFFCMLWFWFSQKKEL